MYLPKYLPTDFDKLPRIDPLSIQMNDDQKTQETQNSEMIREEQILINDQLDREIDDELENEIQK